MEYNISRRNFNSILDAALEHLEPVLATTVKTYCDANDMIAFGAGSTDGYSCPLRGYDSKQYVYGNIPGKNQFTDTFDDISIDRVKQMDPAQDVYHGVWKIT